MNSNSRLGNHNDKNDEDKVRENNDGGSVGSDYDLSLMRSIAIKKHTNMFAIFHNSSTLRSGGYFKPFLVKDRDQFTI